MSLKAVHLVFVGAFSGLAFVCGARSLRHFFSPERASGDLWFGLGAVALGVATVVYGRYFLRKLKGIGYL
jgi:hypothetical protein